MLEDPQPPVVAVKYVQPKRPSDPTGLLSCWTSYKKRRASSFFILRCFLCRSSRIPASLKRKLSASGTGRLSISGCLCFSEGTRQERQHISHNGHVCRFFQTQAHGGRKQQRMEEEGRGRGKSRDTADQIKSNQPLLQLRCLTGIFTVSPT